jgi:predicted dehydrogenase
MFQVGIVGFGRLPQDYYTPALRSLSGVAVAEVADPLAASRAACARAFPAASVHSDYEKLLGRPLDALLVASPPSTHLAVLNAALARGIPVFIEKPVLLFDELSRLEATGEARRLVMPNFNRRFWPPYLRLRDICASGRLGKLRHAEFTLRVDVDPWLSITGHRVEQSEGGALYDLGSSQLDLVQFIMGRKIERIRAHAKTARWRNDDITLEAKLGGGIEVACEISHSDRNRERIVINGDKAVARIENPNRAVHIETGRSTGRSWTNAILQRAKDAWTLAPRALGRRQSALDYTVRCALAEFFAALSACRPFSPDFADAENNLACLEAALLSITEKRFVDIGPAANSLPATVPG